MIDDRTMMAPLVGGPMPERDPGPRFTGGRGAITEDREVMDGIDRHLDRPVVITRSLAPLASGEAARFLRGARLASRLDHAGVQLILAAGVDPNGHAYFVEPRRHTRPFDVYCRGDHAGPPPLPRRLATVLDVARTLAAVHGRGVHHHALRPGVVRVGESGDVRVTGWSHAAVADPVLAAGLGPAPATPAAHDDAALIALLDLALGDDRDLAPELAELTAAGTPPDAAALAAAITDYQDGVRDHALRAERGRALMADAERALAAAGGPDEERALALARRALALDPTLEAASTLVARLLVELPDPLPPAAHAAIARSDQQVMRQLGIGFIGAFGAFTAYVPIMLTQEVRSWPTFIAIAIATTTMLAWAIRWRARGPHVFSWAPMVGAAVVLTLYARTYGPFVNAPAQAALATMAVMLFPKPPPVWKVIAIFAIPVFANLALEAVGVLPATFAVEGGRLVMRENVVAINPATTYVGLAFVSVVLVTVAGAMAGYVATSHSRHTAALVVHNVRVRALAAPLPARRTSSRSITVPPIRRPTSEA